MNEIEKHANYIVNNLKLDFKHKKDLKLQFVDHMNILKNEYIDKGKTEQESVLLAIKDFGDGEYIISEFNYKYQSNTFIKITTILFGIYSIFLLFVLLNPMRSEAEWVASARQGNGYIGVTVNIVPFKTIFNYFTTNSHFFLYNFWGNIVLFIPIGIFFVIIFRSLRKFKSFMLTILLVTISVELIRLLLPLGVSNIDNVILHTSGSLIGFCIYNIYKKISNGFLTKYIPPV